MPPLTTHLLSYSRPAFTAATQHPFLRLCGEATIADSTLLNWLKQDRLYALTYVTFIGSLLSKLSISSEPGRVETLEWRVADLLITALSLIRKELVMFEDVLRQELGWGKNAEAEVRARTETQAYLDLFAGAAGPSQSLLVGMTVLWATEKCYLTSWRWAASNGDKSGVASNNVLQRLFIPNWTSTEFEGFVDNIGRLVDELAQNVEVGGKEWVKCERVWTQVLWAEEHFWPRV